jgi:hypothetical protein
MHDMTMTWRLIFAAGRTNFTFSVLLYNLLLRIRQTMSVAHLGFRIILIFLFFFILINLLYTTYCSLSSSSIQSMCPLTG